MANRTLPQSPSKTTQLEVEHIYQVLSLAVSKTYHHQFTIIEMELIKALKLFLFLIILLQSLSFSSSESDALSQEPTVSSLLQNLHSEFLAKFKDAFDKAVNEERFPSDADHCTLHWIVDSFRDRCADVMMEGATWDITVSERNFRAEVKAHIMSKLKRWSRLAFLLPLGLLALPSLLFLVVHLLRWSVFFSLYQDWLQ
ncbi:hypothetical protein Droror1_Dr00009838 [Drosera rotundifolia]